MVRHLPRARRKHVDLPGAPTRKSPRSSPRGPSPPQSTQFSKLPVELVRQIFLTRYYDSLDNEDEWEDDSEIGSEPSSTKPEHEWRCPPVVLSAVCRYFREVVLATPLLWSQIESTKVHPEGYDWIELCLARSKACPLDIKIDWNDDEDIEDWARPTAGELAALIALLLPSRERWRSIKFTAEPVALLVDLLQRISGPPLPLLEVLCLYANEGVADDDDETAGQILTRSKLATLSSSFVPRLQEFASWRVSVAWDTLELSNLTTLELYYIDERAHYTLQDLHRILSASPKLEYLSVRDPAVELSSSASPFVSLAALTTLKLAEFYSAPQFDCFVDLIQAPSLERLHINSLSEDDYTECIARLGSTSKDRGYRTATKVHLGDIEMLRSMGSRDAYIAFFRGMPNITHLSVNFHEFHYMSPILSFASPIGDPEPELLLPHLHTFQPTNLSYNHAENFVRERFEAHHPLRTLMLVHADTWLQGNVDDFQKFLTGKVEFFEPSSDENEESDSDDEDADSDLSSNVWTDTDVEEEVDDDDEDEDEEEEVHLHEFVPHAHGLEVESSDEEEEVSDDDEESWESSGVDDIDSDDGWTDEE